MGFVVSKLILNVVMELNNDLHIFKWIPAQIINSLLSDIIMNDDDNFFIKLSSLLSRGTLFG